MQINKAIELPRKILEVKLDSSPFTHGVIDEFLDEESAQKIESEFLDFDSQKWYQYRNQIEDKKALNDWNCFPPFTYKFFVFLNSKPFLQALSELIGTALQPDPGLNGGGWHCHGKGGNLNPHLDYSIHPKLGLQRKINLILYLSSQLKPEHGGQLGLWEHDPTTNAPGRLAKEIDPKFNRAVIFDTTQNSWHGMSRPLIQPEGIFRKSLAVYYLCTPSIGADPRGKALFAPRVDQKDDPAILNLIKLRSGVDTASKTYRA